ncbi:MAG: RNA polymerase subunit sigma [Micrococcales bacterium]|nr:MAG: RNA polymerase subunit sigma [Micrococcales bacterium]
MGAGRVEPREHTLETTRQSPFDEVFRTARPSLVRLVARVVGPSEAEDVVQEAFVKLSKDPVLGHAETEVTAWLRRVCLNLAFNRARDVGRWRARTIRAETENTAVPDDPATVVVRSDECTRVRTILDQLPVKQRDALLLRHAGHSYAEVAATLQIPASSVGTTLARAERAFKHLYLALEGETP